MLIRRLLTVFGIIVGLAVMAIAVDRACLAIWQWRIQHYYQAIVAESMMMSSGRIPDIFKVLIVGREKDGVVSTVDLAISGPKPNELLLIHGNNPNLILSYYPPRVCWSQYPPFKPFPPPIKIQVSVLKDWPKPSRGDVLAKLYLPGQQ